MATTPTIKLAFSTDCCPGWDLATILARAKEYGYDGIELAAADTPALGDPATLRQRIADAGLEVAAVNADLALAERLGCPLVKIGPPKYASGVGSTPVMPAGADAAGEKGITLLLENSGEFRTARRVWDFLEQLGDPPTLAVCWNVLSAATAGERPAVSVPTLNRRIAYVEATDAHITADGVKPCKLGEGDVPLEQLLIRLRGIGYRGWVTVSLGRLPQPADPAEFLPHALAKLRQWTRPPAPPAPKKAAAAAKVEAKKPA